MAKLFYSMAGEGRGHAVRARAAIAELSKKHEIYVLAPGDAYDFLSPIIRGPKVKIKKIPAPCFYYRGDHHLDYLKTGYYAAHYLARMPKLIRDISRLIQRVKPDAVITDFEPALPRAARRCGVPVIIFDHQQFLIVNDLSDLPMDLRGHALFMSMIVRLYNIKAERTIVTSFFHVPLKKRFRNRDIVQCSSILRPAVTACERTRKGHLLAYIRKYAPTNVMEALRGCEYPVKIYGLGKQPDDGNLEFHDIHEENFLRDLSSSDGVICTAGNQLLGECFYLDKPVMAIPESQNYEQYINAFYVEKEGAGMMRDMHKLTVEDMKLFIANLETYRSSIDPDSFNGTPTAVRAIEDFLETRAE